MLRHALHIKTWFKASRDVALIVPSSATIERAFPLITQGLTAVKLISRELQEL